jgi:hypothetical protein
MKIIYKPSTLLAALLCAAGASAIIPGVVTNQWPFIAKIGPFPGNLNTGCVAIGDHWVVTAKHVSIQGAQLQIQFDNGATFVSDAKYEHPTDDVALVHFAQTLPGWYGVQWTAPTLGSEIELVGYGWTGTFNGTTWTYVQNYGTKRRGRNNYSHFMSGDLGGGIVGEFMVGDFDSGQPLHNIWDNLGVTDEATIAPWDSGTGVMINDAGTWKVAGVNTFNGRWGAGPNAPQYGSIFGCLRLSGYRTWVDSIMPREVRPTMLHHNRGDHVSGDMSSLFSSDDNRLVYKPGVTLVSSQDPIEYDIMATSPTLNTNRLVLAIESSASSSNVLRKVALYNYDTLQFEPMTPAQCTTTDSVAEYVITSNPGRFIHSNGEVWARISARQNGPILVYPYTFRVDRAVWNIQMP